MIRRHKSNHSGFPLYAINQGQIEKGAAINEQLSALGIRPADLDLVLLSHLDCDHANGLKLVADAKKSLYRRPNCFSQKIKCRSTASVITRIGGAEPSCKPLIGMARKALRVSPMMYLETAALLWLISPRSFQRALCPENYSI